MLDLVLDDARRVRGRLGREDQDKFDEYLDSIRDVEKRVERSQAWVDLPKPEITDQDRERLKLESDSEVPEDYIGTMYELIYLAFRTDSTRVATYQIASMGDATTLAGKFPQLLGMGKNLHSLCHDWNKPEGIEPLGKWDPKGRLTFWIKPRSSTAAAIARPIRTGTIRWCWRAVRRWVSSTATTDVSLNRFPSRTFT